MLVPQSYDDSPPQPSFYSPIATRHTQRLPIKAIRLVLRVSFVLDPIPLAAISCSLENFFLKRWCTIGQSKYIFNTMNSATPSSGEVPKK